MMYFRSARKAARRAALLVTGLLVVGSLAIGVAPASAKLVLDEVPDRSWTVDGRVYAVEVVGDTVFVGGQFTTVTSPSGQVVTRRNLAALRMSDGSLITSWRADAGAVVRALVSDGSSLWVGGHLRSLGGVTANYLGKVSVATGAVDRSFTASLDNAVRGLDVDGNRLFVGGFFTTVNGVSRPHMARVSADTGSLHTGFTPALNGRVLGVSKNPVSSVVYAAGQFTTANGSNRPGLVGLNTETGELGGATLGSTTAPTLCVDVSDDGTRVFSGAGSNAVTGWRTSDGQRLWRDYGEGDIQGVKYYDDVLYFGFHDGFDGDFTVKVLAADAATGAFDPYFRPVMRQFWGVYGIGAGPQGLVVGGDFTNISGVTARGWARFN